MTRLGLGPPARRIGPNNRSLTGRVARQGGNSVAFESSLERDFLVLLDFDPNVLNVHGQPLTLQFKEAEGRTRSYTPDVLVEYREARPVLYEVKYREDLRSQWQELRPKFKAAHRYCKAKGWRFQIITEKEIRNAGYLDNAKFLRPYLTRSRDSDTELTLLRTLRALGETTPQGLLAAAFWTMEHRMAAVGQLWRLVAERRIGINLLVPVTMGCAIWPKPEES